MLTENRWVNTYQDNIIYRLSIIFGPFLKIVLVNAIERILKSWGKNKIDVKQSAFFSSFLVSDLG
jgi:hypothetical protein